jgi:hypothetical protein
MQPMSIEQFNKEIDQSLSDAANGRLTSANSLKEKARNYLLD